MQEQQNIDLVKRLYEPFGKGDIDTISGIDVRKAHAGWPRN
jgi:hypothetical protein